MRLNNFSFDKIKKMQLHCYVIAFFFATDLD